MLTVILIFIALLVVMGWLFPPQGGWLDYIKSCPLVRVFQPGLWDVLLDAGRAIERAHGITGEPT